MIYKKNIIVIISSIIVRFFLLILSVGYFAVYSPNFLKIPFDNFLESIHFTYLSKFELVILFLIISILFEIFEFFSETNLNLKYHLFQNRILQNPRIRKFIEYYPQLSLFLVIIGIFIAFIATLLNNSFFTQMGILLASLGFYGLLLLILLVMMRYLEEKPLHKSLFEYVKEIFKLTYKLKILIFLGSFFGITFIVLAHILISYGLGQQSYITAMLVSGALTVAILNQIDRFITHDIVKK